MAMYTGNKLFTSDRYSQLHKLYNHSKREVNNISLIQITSHCLYVLIRKKYKNIGYQKFWFTMARKQNTFALPLAIITIS